LAQGAKRPKQGGGQKKSGGKKAPNRQIGKGRKHVRKAGRAVEVLRESSGRDRESKKQDKRTHGSREPNVLGKGRRRDLRVAKGEVLKRGASRGGRGGSWGVLDAVRRHHAKKKCKAKKRRLAAGRMAG